MKSVAINIKLLLIVLVLFGLVLFSIGTLTKVFTNLIAKFSGVIAADNGCQICNQRMFDILGLGITVTCLCIAILGIIILLNYSRITKFLKDKTNILFLNKFIFISLVIAALAIQAYLVFYRYMDADEFEHLHASWLVVKGLVPYLDFFEHHTPLLWYCLAPFFIIFKNNINIIFYSRIFIFVTLILILMILYKLTSLAFNKRIGIYSVFFLTYAVFFMKPALEIRPDVPQVLCWLISLYLFVKALYEEKDWQFAVSGMILGVAFLFSQKTIFAGIGVGIVCVVFLYHNLKNNKALALFFRKIAIFTTGLCAPVLIALAYFYSKGALKDFFVLNFAFNSNYVYNFTPYGVLKLSFIQNIPFWILGLIGLIYMALHYRKLFLVIPVCVLFAGFFLVKAPFVQYLMPLAPLISICAAFAYDKLAFRLVRSKSRGYVLGAIFLFILLAVLVPIGFQATYALTSNKEQIAVVKYIQDNTEENSAVYGSINIFNPDVHYLWFQKYAIPTLERIDFGLDYNLSKSLIEHKTKFVFLDGRVPDVYKEFIINNYNPTNMSTDYGVLYIATDFS